MLKNLVKRLIKFLELGNDLESMRKAILTGVSASVILYVLWTISVISGYEIIIGSFGASIFLVLVAPKVEFSQPKNLMGGHLITALVGLTTFYFLGPEFWALTISLGLSVTAMQVLRVSHPPAASNPLIIYASAPDWTYFLIPTLVGALILGGSAHILHKTILYPKY